MVRINGQDLDVAGKILQEYLDESEYTAGRYVVEYNREIIRQETYGNVLLKDGDEIEIVSFMGGGC